MTGWDWCKAVLDPELVGYYRVDGDKVTFTTKEGKRFVLTVADWADVEHGKKQVAAVMAGKVPPAVEPVVLPTLEDVMVDAPVEVIELTKPVVVEPPKPLKKPRDKKAIQNQDVDLQSL